MDNERHNRPHIHVKYNNENAVFSKPECDLIRGSLNKKKRKLVEAWIVLNEESLMADWELAI